MGQVGRLNRRQWALVRRMALERDGWRCRTCGKAGRLEVDHVKPLFQGGEPFELGNLSSQCRDCHKKKSTQENGGGPGPERMAWKAYLEDGIMGG